MLAHDHDSGWNIPVISTVAITDQGISELFEKTLLHRNSEKFNVKKIYLLTEKIFQLLRNYRMKDISREDIRKRLENAKLETSFNLYRFIDQFNN